MRYVILILLNLPVILLAFINILAQYKMNHITKTRFRRQVIIWLIILVVLVSSFPIYNLVNGNQLLDSSELSLFDIVQTTAIIFLFYIINYQRQHIEHTERTVHDLHQELAIMLSEKNGKN